MVAEVVEAFGSFKNREWLSWGSDIMPGFAIEVKAESESEAAARRASVDRKAQEGLRKIEELQKEAAENVQTLTKSLEEKKITKEEYKSRYRAIKTALEQRISALEATGEGDRDETQRTVASSATQDSRKVVPNEAPKVTLPVPTKRKSSERLSDPKPGHPKVSNTCD